MFASLHFIVPARVARVAGAAGAAGRVFCPAPHSLLREFGRQQSYGSMPGRGTYIFAHFVATERLGSEEREVAAVTKCSEEPVGQSWAHFQKSSDIKRFLEECRLLSTF